MKSIVKATLIASFAIAPLALSAAEPNAAARTDLYHVHFAKAAPGKTAQMQENMKKPDPLAPMPDHVIVLRHQDGDAWDFVAIEHLGTKVTLDAARQPVPPAQRNLGDWHTDTYATGPSWAEFAKAMGIDGAGKAKTASAAYTVSTYRAVPGGRDALDAFLSEPPSRPSDTSVGGVLLQHLEGADWNFLSVVRYDSWQSFGTNESNNVADTAKGQGGFFKLRELVAHHTDTLATRVAP
jgi:hypothetical protein